MRKLSMLLATTLIATAVQSGPPRLVEHGSTQNLLVHDKPYLILGGELGNSSASSAQYMQPHWPRLRAMNLNTVLAPVYWELLEPVENEIGMLPVVRERGAEADRAFNAAAPAELLRALSARGAKLEPELRDRMKGRKASGSWAEVFGEDEWGQEVFTAWHYARFSEALVKAGAPSLDFLAPDIYFPNFSACRREIRRYRRCGSIAIVEAAQVEAAQARTISRSLAST